MIVTDQTKLAKSMNIRFLSIRDLKTDKNLNEIQVVICNRIFAKRLIEYDLPCLKFIQLTSVGFDGVDLALLRKRNIMVSNTKNVYSKGMAEYVVYALLKSAKRHNRSIRNNLIRFQRNYRYITELAGKKVTIIGVGDIGSEIAKRLSAFDMQVFGFAKNKRV